MKIIALSNSDYPPTHSPMAQRLHCYMLALKSCGHEVKVVFFSDKYYSSVFEGIPYNSIVFNYENPLVFSRKYKKEYILAIKDEILAADVFFHSEHRISLICGIQKFAAMNNVKVINELNEYPYCSKFRRLELDIIRLLKQKIYWSLVLPKIDGIIVISHALEAKVKLRNKNVIRIPILAKHFAIKRKPRIESDVPYILHAGALSETKDGIKAVFKGFNLALKELDGNLKLVFTNKQTFPELIKWIDSFILKNGLTNKVEFKGTVTNDELDVLYENCSLAIVNKPINLQNNYNFPTKLTELLPRAIPVIISRTSELKYYFKDQQNSLMVEPNDYKSISEKIVKLIKNPRLQRIIGENGRKLSERSFHYSKNAEKLNCFFTKILKTNDK